MVKFKQDCSPKDALHTIAFIISCLLIGIGCLYFMYALATWTKPNVIGLYAFVIGMMIYIMCLVKDVTDQIEEHN
jgi:hypothetical protein